MTRVHNETQSKTEILNTSDDERKENVTNCVASGIILKTTDPDGHSIKFANGSPIGGGGRHHLKVNVSNSKSSCESSSEDDTASIVSRLSQIVIEQQRELEKPSGKANLVTSPIKQVKSVDNVCGLVVNFVDPRRGSYASEITSPSSLSSCNTPEIVIKDDENESIEKRIEDKDPTGDFVGSGPRKRSRSVAHKPDVLHEDVQIRNESGARLPERGSLRQLESIRHQNLMRPIHNRKRACSIDKNMLGGSGDLMLNIQRSTWTLSEFDKTFNKVTSSSEDSSSDESNYQTGSTTSIENARTTRTSLDKQTSSNLLIRASVNALNLNQHKTNQIVSTGDLINYEQHINHSNFEKRISRDSSRRGSRLSHCHSIVSVGSSLYNGNKGNRKIGFKKMSNEGDELGKDHSGCCCKFRTIARYLPILEWLPAYRTNLLWGDLMAGLAVATLNISTSLSAAVVAETELSTAFRASIISTFVYAILSSSKHVSFGSWSIISQMLIISVQRALSDELILNRINLGPTISWEPEEYEQWHLNIMIMYTFLIGLVQLVFGFLNLGNVLSSFIPEALSSSMIAATAFTMAIGQLANMCGTSNKILWSIERNTTSLLADLKNPPIDITDVFAGTFRWIRQIALLIKYNDQINMTCVIISLISISVLILNQYVIQDRLKKLFKRTIFIPVEVILPISGIVASYALDLSNTYRVSTCGPIELEVALPNVPDLRLFRELFLDSVATALISYTLVFIIARSYSNKLNYEIDCNQELIACGAGNLIGGLFDALPATASFSRTAGQVEAGGNTQMASIINCVLLVVASKILGHHVAVLPICVMSASLFFGFIRMMSRITEVFDYWRLCKVDFTIWVVTFGAILTLDLVNGFVYGFIFSILTMLYRAQNRRCYMLGTIGTSDVYVPLDKYPTAEEIDNIKIFQFCGPIHYVCADSFERLLRQKTGVNVKEISHELSVRPDLSLSEMNLPTHIILDFSMISYIDSAGIHMIKKIIEDYMVIKVNILIASLASHVAAVVKSEPQVWGVYKNRFYITLADAVHRATRDNQKAQLFVSAEKV